MSNEGALATLDVPQALAELASGTILGQIAARYGVTKVAVRKKLIAADPLAYELAIREQATALVEQATAEVMECNAETVNIARARVDAAHKYAAARDPATWGQKAQVTVINGGALDACLREAEARLIGSGSTEAAQQLGLTADGVPETPA